MRQYDVWVSSARYQRLSPLTYAFDGDLADGSLVKVPLQKETTLGIVIQKSQTKLSVSLKSIQEVLPVPPLPATSLRLLEWMMSYYPAPSGITTKLFLPADSKLPAGTEATHNTLTPTQLPPLTSEQATVLQALAQQAKPGSTTILHGDTGTGKTRIYLELTRQALAQGKSSLILTPEIGLTTQLAQTFHQTFPGHVQVLHSGLTVASRRLLWHSLHSSNQPVIIIGTRSALFAPLKNLGVIVVDESHDSSYKQGQAPHYHATRVASKLAQLHHAQCLYGSATPSITDYYYAEAKGAPIIRMTQPASRTHTPPDQANHVLVDLKDKAQFKQSFILSDPLLAAIQQALSQKQQSLVFLNRRGTARLMLCQNCAWHALCPNCDLPLTYHGDEHKLRCHICGNQQIPPTICPECGKTDITLQHIGTKSVVEELARLFPQATLRRFDSDSKAGEKLEKHYEVIVSGKVDILIGTQMLAKGLDLPRLAAVGIVIADTSLFMPDFTSEEQTFQLITQVIGRLSRHAIAGTVVLQSFNPASSLLRAALEKAWPSFYAGQLQERRAFNFPPFSYLLKLEYAAARQTTSIGHATKLAKTLRAAYPSVTVLGPAPAFHEKVRGKYHWQLVLKSKQRSNLLQIIRTLPSGWLPTIDPVNLL